MLIPCRSKRGGVIRKVKRKVSEKKAQKILNFFSENSKFDQKKVKKR